MKNILLTIAFVCTIFSPSKLFADEGMWMLNQLDKQTIQQMKKLGLELSARQLYNPKGGSLKSAIVSFGGFCTGVVVSPDGLVFTNHHCGFESIQRHSSPQMDLIQNGFFAATRKDELPNPDLYVSFMLSTENVTKEVMRAVKPQMDEQERQNAIDSICSIIQDRAIKKDTTLTAIVSPYYTNNEYYLSIYQDYKDIRLVFAPPSSIGKFGGETDNWVWPRHTGDFSVFRIYAGKDNKPAEFSTDNVPYRAENYAPISLGGYQDGSFCMTIGFPGETQRYLSSYGVKERMLTENAAMIQVRAIKQKIWKEAMQKNDSIRIMYASKYDESANYYKNSLGMNQSIEKLGVITQKQRIEQQLMTWIKAKPAERNKYLHVLTELELGYRNRLSDSRAFAFLLESFANNSSELLKLALTLINTDFSEENKELTKTMTDIAETYANCDMKLDKKIFLAMLDNYREQVPDTLRQPDFYQRIRTQYGNNTKAFTDSVYTQSALTTPKGMINLLRKDSTDIIFKDPAIMMAIDIMTKLYELRNESLEATIKVESNERLLTQAIREMEQGQPFYSDANSTMRLSFGTVCDYQPKDGIRYNYYTTTAGIAEKAREHTDDKDFNIQPKALEILQNPKTYGLFADPNGKMRTCFITNNDITGGNSGSPMFNGKGELIGLAFDGNWEAMSSDLIFEPQLQRCIGVDIKYVLYVISRLSSNDRLIKEVSLK